MSDDIKTNRKELFEIILKLKTVEDCEIFFDDLCTYKELESMSGRIQVAKLLAKNETYEQIVKKTDVSSATLSRVNKCLKYGKGYKKFIK